MLRGGLEPFIRCTWTSGTARLSLLLEFRLLSDITPLPSFMFLRSSILLIVLP